MSRLAKYKESLNKFIQERSNILNPSIFVKKPELNIFINNYTNNSDFILPILLLTIMNNRSKKNKITLQGYYFASCIHCLDMIIYLQDNKYIYHKLFTKDNFNILINYLIMQSNKLLYQNLLSIHNLGNANNKKIISTYNTNIILKCFELFNEKTENIYLDDFFQINQDNNANINQDNNKDIEKWYLKNNLEQIKKLRKIKLVSNDNYKEYIDNKYLQIVVLAFCMGWISGGGDVQIIQNKQFTNMIKYFAYLIKIGKDYSELDNNINNLSNNYVINFGMLDSYEDFLTNKEKFIQNAMIYDIYTLTIKEILNKIENYVDDVIDNTSLDMKSSFSISSQGHNNL
jgi:ribosomal protein S8